MGLINVDEHKVTSVSVTPMDFGTTSGWATRTDLVKRLHCDLASSNRDVAARQHQRHQRSLEMSKILTLLKDDIKRMMDCHPKIRNLLDVDVQDQQKVCALRRNQSVKNLRCLTTFYGFQTKTFCLATNLLDRFASKVKVQPRYLPCAAAACFLIAAGECEDASVVPPVGQLLRVSQCDCTPSDVARMQAIVLAKVPSFGLSAVTPLTLVERFVAALGAWFAMSQPMPTSSPAAGTAAALPGVAAGVLPFDEAALARASSSKLCSIMCQADLLLDKPSVIALGIVQYCLEEMGFSKRDLVNYFVMLQDVCDIGDAEFTNYYEGLKSYLNRCDDPTGATASRGQSPRTEMRWTISRRTMALLRPSCGAVTDLPVIHEAPCDESVHSATQAGAASVSSSMSVPFCCSSSVMEVSSDAVMADVQRADECVHEAGASSAPGASFVSTSSAATAGAAAAPVTVLPASARSWAAVVAASSQNGRASGPLYCVVGTPCRAAAAAAAAGGAAATAGAAVRLGCSRS